MRDKTLTPSTKKNTHARTSSHRQGVRLTKQETIAAKEKFLKSFSSNGIVRVACASAGVDRSTVRAWEEHDEEFCMAYNLAKEDVNDAIRAEVYRRGMFGDERYEISAGQVVYHEGKPLTIKEKSDLLLMFHAKARMPEYRDKQQVEVSGSLAIVTEWGGGALTEESEVQHGSSIS